MSGRTGSGGRPVSSSPESVPLRDYAEEAPESARVGDRVVRPDQPIPVRAWIVQRQSRESEALGEALAWTSRQVQVRYIDAHGREGWAWLWANAVTRR